MRAKSQVSSRSKPKQHNQNSSPSFKKLQASDECRLSMQSGPVAQWIVPTEPGIVEYHQNYLTLSFCGCREVVFVRYVRKNVREHARKNVERYVRRNV